MSVQGGTLLYSSLPQVIRDLKPGDKGIAFATFSDHFRPEETYTISLEGNRHGYKFYDCPMGKVVYDNGSCSSR